MNETQRRFLRRLRDAAASGLRRSSIPKSCGELIESLQTCAAVEFRPALAGRGITLHIKSEQSFQRFLAARLPQGLDVDLAAIPDRASAVFLLADAKAVRRGIGQGIFVRATKPDIEIQSMDGELSISVSDLTSTAGGIGIQLCAQKVWTFAGSVAVVENADAFWQHERVLPDVDMAILGNGNMSSRLLEWLASPAMSNCHIVHWGDYDPVGICQYIRLTDACIGRVESFAPAEVDQLLPRYGKRRLVTHQTTFLDRLRRRESDPYVKRMLALFDVHRRGLEQEVLLVTASDLEPSSRSNQCKSRITSDLG